MKWEEKERRRWVMMCEGKKEKNNEGTCFSSRQLEL